MSRDASFCALLSRVRGGDQAAASDLVRRFGPDVRRAAQARLARADLRRAVDAEDVCQAVFGAFFARLAAGRFDLKSPTELTKLLGRMARNNVFDHMKRAANRRTQSGGPGLLEEAADPADSPSEIASTAELIARARKRLTEEEQALVALRTEGRSWEEVGSAVGKAADAVRRQHDRALGRLRAELQLG